MEKFTQVDPQIKAKELENTVADKHQKEEQVLARQRLEKDPKFYIKRNMRDVKIVDKKFQTQKLQEEIDEDLKQQRLALKQGHLPNYLVKFKKEAELDKQRTLQQIELNKRPQGTIRLKQDEIESIRKNLGKEQKALNQRITQTSVTLYTTRAQRENRALVDKMEEVDRAITVFGRDRVFIKK